jgi:YtcA-like protein
MMAGRRQMAIPFLGAVILSGCDPVVDIEGAFFPSWMLSLLVGVLLTVALRLLFLRSGLEPYLGPLPLIYTCLALLLTMTTWVLFFHV